MISRGANLLVAILLLIGALPCSSPAVAQTCSDSTVPGTLIQFFSGPNLPNVNANCIGLYCHEPIAGGPYYVVSPPGCDGTTQVCTVQLRVPLTMEGNHQASFGLHARIFWFDEASPTVPCPPPPSSCSPISICGLPGSEFFADTGDASIQIGGLTCDDLANAPGVGSYSLSVYVCQGGGSCQERDDAPDLFLTAPALSGLLGCPKPKPEQCPSDNQCGSCVESGDGDCGGGASIGGGGAGASPCQSGPQALLHYQAGGTGNPGLPISADWNTLLGRHWSHTYAERIVQDPDEFHVWLLTQWATFREFTDGDSDGIYESVAPSDEYRRLVKVAGGWELTDLDGTVQSFDGNGRWTQTVDRNGNAHVATYVADVLASVSTPDARSETFAYHPDGKLASITEVGVGGGADRSWTYTWTGPDLVRIDRPDGTAWEFFYDDGRYPGYMTRMDLVGTDTSRRVDTAWEYDGSRNVIRMWKGDVSFDGPDAVEKWSLSFDAPALPLMTTVTNPLGDAAVYTLGRDPGSDKTRIEVIDGGCPTCGVGPNSALFYEDAAHPLRVTRVIDGAGNETVYTYDSNGQRLSMVEAAQDALARTTTWQYNPAFPALPTVIERPSVAGGAELRRTLFGHDGSGNVLQWTVEGREDALPFSLSTVMVYGAAGELTSIDPPGFGPSDQTGYTYDPARGDLVALTRTDPLVGTTTFDYDAFNRNSSIEDPNALVTLVEYDDLDRVTRITEKGKSAGDDLITRNVYNVFGDLFQAISPEGNLVEFDYDAAGRLISVEKKPDAATHVERTELTLDDDGNRIRTEHQRWDGNGWVVESFSESVFDTACQLARLIDADGSVSEFAYDCAGNLSESWDANHPSAGQTAPPTAIREYDALNRVIRLTQPWETGDDAVTEYQWDVQDHLTGITDAEGNVTTLVFSDRDLVTAETSPESGTTTLVYNEHGAPIEETDALGVIVTRQVDELDRVTLVDYSDPSLDTTYTYDDPASNFSLGRLTRVARNNGEVRDLEYDRFGRTVRDGELTFGHDRNGNRTTIGYPGGVTARYTYDHADRPLTLEVSRSAGGAFQAVVTAADYAPMGPLSGLSFAGGAVETRAHDQRYFLDRITVAGTSTHLDWSYTTDDVGNVGTIADLLNPANDRVYGYRDIHYFLESGDGPWGTRSWTYDKIGNRLSETRDAATFDYSYVQNPGGGNTPILDQVQSAAAGAAPTTLALGRECGGRLGNLPGIDCGFCERDGPSTRTAGRRQVEASGSGEGMYGYDTAGNLTSVSAPSALDLTYDDAGRLSLVSQPGGASADFVYDGQGYLALAGRPATTHTDATLELTHDSGGRPYRYLTQLPFSPCGVDENYLFWLGDRPVATWNRSLCKPLLPFVYLTTDHLETVILAIDEAGDPVWEGGLEPFGETWAAGPEPVLRRFPGQLEHTTWDFSGLYYNRQRWYDLGTGRYTRPDPMGPAGDLHLYRYAASNPMGFVDPSGLQLVVEPPFPFVPDPGNPVPRGCSGGPWVFDDYEYERRTEDVWKRTRATPIKIAGPRGGRGSTIGCRCDYALDDVQQVVETVARYKQTITCPPCTQYDRTARRKTVENRLPVGWVAPRQPRRRHYAPWVNPQGCLCPPTIN